jgi:hypothetical protein
MLRPIRPLGLVSRLDATNGRSPDPPAAAGIAVANFYSIRGERILIRQLDYDLPFRWFVEMSASGC